MEDSKRDSEIVLRQVVNILLELASQRFDMSCANTKLKIIYNTQIGNTGKMFDLWLDISFLRCMTPPLNIACFPLYPGDFHSRNILIFDVDTSSVSLVLSIGSFLAPTEHPLVIVDNLMWEHNHPLRTRNVRDQATFISLMREAERKKVKGDPPLSHAKEVCTICLGLLLTSDFVTVILFRTRSDTHRHHRQSSSEDIRSQPMPYTVNNGNNGHGIGITTNNHIPLASLHRLLTFCSLQMSSNIYTLHRFLPLLRTVLVYFYPLARLPIPTFHSTTTVISHLVGAISVEPRRLRGLIAERICGVLLGRREH